MSFQCFGSRVSMGEIGNLADKVDHLGKAVNRLADDHWINLECRLWDILNLQLSGQNHAHAAIAIRLLFDEVQMRDVGPGEAFFSNLPRRPLSVKERREELAKAQKETGSIATPSPREPRSSEESQGIPCADSFR